jgi:ADP-heptose:LPS heptosyltransferase
LKYNLGCGADYHFGWVNVDRFAAANPDIVMDLEAFPWSLPDDSADEILLSHVLEHLGGTSDIFLKVMQELYRVCKPGAKVTIRVPDPRHDDYLSDPTHQRPVIPGLFQPFDLALNEAWQAIGLPGTPLGKYLQIDFAVVSATPYLDPRWRTALDEGRIGADALGLAMRGENKVVQWHEIVLEAVKPFAPGRSLKSLAGLVVRRTAGLGDVLMAVSALSAIKRATGAPVYLETAPDYAEIAALTGDLDGVFTDGEAARAHIATLAPGTVKYLDWSAAGHGAARRHQVESFLGTLGLTLNDADKGLRMLPALDADPEGLAALGLPTRAAGQARVLLHAGVTDPNRTWPEGFWRGLAEALIAEGRQVALIGRSDGADGRGAQVIAAPGLIDLTDTLSLTQTLTLMRASDLLVSGDAGPIQLAGATDIAIVGLYSVVSGASRLPFRRGSVSTRAIAVAPACPFHPCYPRINDREALGAFIAREGLSPTDGPAIFSTWCLNEDRYACLRDADAAENVRAAIAALL